MANKTSQHILGTSSNLLGFCLFVLTSLHLTNKSENSLIDEFTSIVALFLAISSFLSFVSIKTENKKMEYRYEQIADYLFLGSLLGIFGIIVFIIQIILSKIWLKYFYFGPLEWIWRSLTYKKLQPMKRV